MNQEKSLQLHQKLKGKIKIAAKMIIKSSEDLATLYSPGVAYPCLEIAKNPEKVYDYTMKANTLGVITDGTAVLGLGNIGSLAAMPVMEGKCLLFNQFAQIDAIPICLDTVDPDEIIRTCQILAPSLGGINLEDISAPRCVYIERKLKELLNIPVFHDDQHGTRIVVCAAILNIGRLYQLDITKFKVVVSGLGAAGSSIVHGLNRLGIKDIYGYDRQGIVTSDKYDQYDFVVQELIDQGKLKCYDNKDNHLNVLLKDADIFIGVSAGNLLTAQDIKPMRHRFVFALANPTPELSYQEALKASVEIYATGRSDYPNQVNNLLAFPGLFKGVLACQGLQINDEIIDLAITSLSQVVKDDQLSNQYIIPNPFDPLVVKAISEAIINKYQKK